MYKIVLDADGAIKLAKAGVLEDVAEFAECLIPKQVYAEIVRGKEKKHQDAFAIELLVASKKLKVVNADIKEEKENLGIGEKAALVIFKTYKAQLIVSDDRKFLNKLESRGVSFVTPVNLLMLLVKNKKMTKEKGLQALNKIKNTINEYVYTKAIEILGGDKI